MFQLQRAIIKPKTEQIRDTFNDCALYGITYRLYFELYYGSYVGCCVKIEK